MRAKYLFLPLAGILSLTNCDNSTNNDIALFEEISGLVGSGDSVSAMERYKKEGPLSEPKSDCYVRALFVDSYSLPELTSVITDCHGILRPNTLNILLDRQTTLQKN